MKERMILRNGSEIPVIGFGTWQAPNGQVTQDAVNVALECGFVTLILLQFMEMKRA